MVFSYFAYFVIRIRNTYRMRIKHELLGDAHEREYDAAVDYCIGGGRR